MKLLLIGFLAGSYCTIAVIYYKDLRKSNGALKSFLNASVWIVGVVHDMIYKTFDR